MIANAMMRAVSCLCLLGLVVGGCADDPAAVDASVADATVADAASTADVDTGAADATVADAASTADAVAPANLVVSPSTFDFGAVCIGGSSADAAFTVSNDGGAASGALVVELSGISAAQFAIVSDNCEGASLAPSGTCVVVLRMAVLELGTGAKFAALEVSASPGGAAMATVAGDLLACDSSPIISPNPHDFGAANVGASGSSQTFIVSNPGGNPLGPAMITIGGANPGDFAIDTNACDGVAIPPGGTCAIAIVFMSSAMGPRSASLVVSTAQGWAIAGLTGSGL